MEDLFFLLSGEYETLSFSELKAILEAEEFDYRVTEKLDQVARIKADVECIAQIKRRSAYTRICAQELFVSEAMDEAIVKASGSAEFDHVLKEGETFEVRIRRIREYSAKDDTMRLERKLGKLILEKTTGTAVNLKSPMKTFFGVLTSHKLIFGVRLAEIQPKPFVDRRPRRKPFFHPSAMNAKLARCMVNLSRARTGETVLDPFCGTGTTALEAAMINCRAIGMDVQRRMLEGTRRNLANFGVNAEALVIADAGKLPFLRVDAVVTDPPYGKSATTLKSTTKTLVENVFRSAKPLLGKGQRMCIASPKTLQVAKLGEAAGYKYLESHYAYVHRTLTREIAVFEKEDAD